MSWLSRLFGRDEYADARKDLEFVGCCSEICRESEQCLINEDLENERIDHGLTKNELEKTQEQVKNLTEENFTLKEELRKAQESAMRVEVQKHTLELELQSRRRECFDKLTTGLRNPTPCAVRKR